MRYAPRPDLSHDLGRFAHRSRGGLGCNQRESRHADRQPCDNTERIAREAMPKITSRAVRRQRYIAQVEMRLKEPEEADEKQPGDDADRPRLPRRPELRLLVANDEPARVE